jgi:hypothetical protein
MDRVENTVSNNNSIVLCVFVAAGTCLPICSLETGCITPLFIYLLQSNGCTCYDINIKRMEQEYIKEVAWCMHKERMRISRHTDVHHTLLNKWWDVKQLHLPRTGHSTANFMYFTRFHRSCNAHINWLVCIIVCGLRHKGGILWPYHSFTC